MATEVVAKFENKADGIESCVTAMGGNGYVVSLYDTDAEQNIGAFRKFVDRGAAIEYAKHIVS